MKIAQKCFYKAVMKGGFFILATGAGVASLPAYSQGLIFDEDILGPDLITELNTTDGTVIRQFIGPVDLEAMAPGITPDVLGSDEGAREIDTLEALTNVPRTDLAAGDWQGTLVEVGAYLRFFGKGETFSTTFDDSGLVLFYPAALKAICHRAIWLDGAQVRRDGEAGEVLAAYSAAG